MSNVESRIQQCRRLLLDSSNGTFTTISEDLAKLRKAVENVRHQSDLVLSKKRAITNSLDELEIKLRSARQSDGDHHTPVEFVVGAFHCSVVCESMLTSLVVNQDQSPIHCMDVVAQVAMLICVMCHIMFGVDTRGGIFIMGAISLLLYLAFQTSKGTPSLSQENILQRIPSTIQTALSRFQLSCKTVIYTVCSCHCTYAPTYAQGSTVPKYPEFCTHCPTPEFECGEPLLDMNACGDSQPKKVFTYHEFNDYLANLLSRADIEVAMDNSCNKLAESLSSSLPCFVKDPFDAQFLHKFQGPEPGKLFVDRGDEGRYAFALHVDFFNPEGMSMQGATMSSGIISMACLNLPLDIRYKPENMYLAGIIPGPKLPLLENLNHYIRPLIDDLVASWDRGIWFSKTANYPNGRIT